METNKSVIESKTFSTGYLIKKMEQIDELNVCVEQLADLSNTLFELYFVTLDAPDGFNDSYKRISSLVSVIDRLSGEAQKYCNELSEREA